MSTQYTKYSSADAAGPGVLTGQAGKLLTILQACLVDGYAGKPAAGWSNPQATAGNIGSFQQGAGAGFGCVINDNGPNVTSTYKEAWVTGWESVAGVGAPVGTGAGQFPLPAQQLVTGHGVIRKSASADATGRTWDLYADDRTFILFILTGDGAGVYGSTYFGDIYSLAGAGDLWRCLLWAQPTENGSVASADVGAASNYVTSTVAGHFLARTWGGGGASITAGKHGDTYKSSSLSLAGIVQTPNSADNSYYLSPIWVHENSGAIVRGRLRGVFQLCHAIAGFADGQTIAGGSDYAGKEFRIVKQVPAVSAGNACLAIETTNTVEAN